MGRREMAQLDRIYACCRRHVPPALWQRVREEVQRRGTVEGVPALMDRVGVHGYWLDLARVERALHNVRSAPAVADPARPAFSLNPTLEVVPVGWAIAEPLQLDPPLLTGEPRRQHGWVLVWRRPLTGEVLCRMAADHDLLALKVVEEDLLESAAPLTDGGRVVRSALWAAANEGLVLPPETPLCRAADLLHPQAAVPGRLLRPQTFTLQWHITQACDLHCRHCYDRSARKPVSRPQAALILDDFESFCWQHAVQGHVCLSGGNPCLHPEFEALYADIAGRGLSLSVLGNPVDFALLERICAISPPRYFQVSLEGGAPHNDRIRGRDHFSRTIDFLDALCAVDVPSSVMLTLTRDNLCQVLPLADTLQDRTDCFTFARMAPVGNASSVDLPTPGDYQAFLSAYVDAAADNPTIGFKDNLINVELYRRGAPLFDGCTGFGCGAAFNCVALLSDGEVHACRKFPSRIGNVLQDGFTSIYGGTAAARYRAGSAACRGCTIRHVCGGCLAVMHGHGCDITRDRDPFCSMDRAAGPGS